MTEASGIETAVHYAVPLHAQLAFRALLEDSACPVAEQVVGQLPAYLSCVAG